MSLLFFENRMIIILLRKGCAATSGQDKVTLWQDRKRYRKPQHNSGEVTALRKEGLLWGMKRRKI